MLLAFELAQRAAGKGGPDWTPYINQFLSVAESGELKTNQSTDKNT
jgi:hypothetical protein